MVGDVFESEGNMKMQAKTEEYTVYNKPPFVNEILAAIRPETLNEKEFISMVHASAVYDVNTMMMTMTREYDVSGMVPNLVGVCKGPQEVLKIFTEIAHSRLSTLSNMGMDIYNEVMETLAGSSFSMRALVILDDIQRDVISRMLIYRQSSELAMSTRQAMEDSLRLLYLTPIKIRSEIFDQALRLGELERQWQGIPRICYPRLVNNGEVQEVWQYFHLPRLEYIHLSEHSHKLTVLQELNSLTPDFYIRDSSYDDHYDPESPVGFMGLLGKIGNALPRMVVEQVKRNSRIKANVLKEDAVSSALYELFTSYPKTG
jgi:hypothetical protein